MYFRTLTQTKIVWVRKESKGYAYTIFVFVTYIVSILQIVLVRWMKMIGTYTTVDLSTEKEN